MPPSGQVRMGMDPNPYSYFIFETGFGIMRTGPRPHTFPRSHRPLPEVGGTGSTFQYPQGTRPGIMRTGPLPHTFPRSHRPLPEVGEQGPHKIPSGVFRQADKQEWEWDHIQTFPHFLPTSPRGWRNRANTTTTPSQMVGSAAGTTRKSWWGAAQAQSSLSNGE